ncbi:hypothetical protein V8D89_004657 [Ganoderma adspersum]
MAPKLKRSRSRSRSRSITPTIPQRVHGDDPERQLNSLPQPPSHRAKKLKLLASHSISSPFPDFPHPTTAEAGQIHALLASTHPDIASSYTPPPDEVQDGSGSGSRGNAAQTCGQVANVLDSLIGTILSQNTTAKNSTAAKHALDAAFGRHNFRAIAEARREDVAEAIKTGGLANKKAGVIQKILRDVYERHGAYSLQHLSRVTPSTPSATTSDPSSKGKLKGDAARDGRGQAAATPTITDEEAMQELVSYDGVGPKTASCVLLFCLGRASFPVDTHVFRLSRLLGWVPPRADRVTAQAHLDLTIPDGLKYGLHVLMVGHGRRCKGCKGTGGGKSAECVLKRWLRGQKGAKGPEEMEATVVKAEEDAAEEAADCSADADVKSEVS